MISFVSDTVSYASYTYFDRPNHDSYDYSGFDENSEPLNAT